MDCLFYIFTLIASGIGAYVGNYLNQKGKNFADKQDIEEITQKIESVKSEFFKQHETLRSFHETKHIAAEKRLDKHQEAYTLSIKLLQNVHSDKHCPNVVMEAQEWLRQNALYLTPKSREAFLKCYRAANDHTGLLDSSPRNDQLTNNITNNFSKIKEATTIIAKEADLPSFADSYDLPLEELEV